MDKRCCAEHSTSFSGWLLSTKGSSFNALMRWFSQRRITWPGQEKEDSLVHMQMDASGEGLYLIDLNTGRYIQETFTVEEQELFNAFELGEQATNINHRELLSELFGVVLLGPEHAGKLINLINDNTAAEHWTSKDHHQDARVDQILSILGRDDAETNTHRFSCKNHREFC